jgi:hypothetical protein
MFAKTKIALIAALLGVVGVSAASAAPKEFCRIYANSAVNQANRMNALQIGCFGFRWHNWYDGHYQWCRSASIDSARSETMVRRQAFFNGQC